MHFLWFIVVQIASCDDTRAEFLSLVLRLGSFGGVVCWVYSWMSRVLTCRN